MTQEVAGRKRLHASRVVARAAAAELFERAQKAVIARGEGSATDRAIASRWDISKTAVADYGDPTSGVAIALGDVLALPCRELARQVLVGALAALDQGGEVQTRDSLDRVAIELGAAVAQLHRDLADGREDEHDAHAAAFTRIATIALRGAASCGRRGGAQ